jgi:hypothetical protein
MAKKKRRQHCIGIAKPCHHTALGARAARHFGYTNDLSEAGYVMPNGRFLDFSGRNEHPDYTYDEDYNRYVVKVGRRDEQSGQRPTDHRQVAQVKGFPKAGKDERGDDISPVYTFLVEAGAARVNEFAGIELASVPTEKLARAISVAWNRENYGQPMEVEMWLTPRQVVADSVERPTAAKIIEVAKKQFAKCRCTSGLEPCCHRKRRKKVGGRFAVTTVKKHTDPRYLSARLTFEPLYKAKVYKTRKSAENLMTKFHRDEVAKGFKDDLTELRVVNLDE